MSDSTAVTQQALALYMKGLLQSNLHPLPTDVPANLTIDTFVGKLTKIPILESLELGYCVMKPDMWKQLKLKSAIESLNRGMEEFWEEA